MLSKSRFYLATLFALLASMFSAPVLATAPTDVTELAASVDYATVITALFAVGGAVIVVYIAKKGIMWVWGMVKTA